MSKIVFTDRGIPLMVKDRIAVYVENKSIQTGEITSIMGDNLGVLLDSGSKIKVNIYAGRILAELNKKNKFPIGVKRMSELRDVVKDYGGDLYKDVKVPDIKQSIKTGDIIFVFNNRQAIAKEVFMIRAKTINKGMVLILRDNDGIKYLDKDNFDKIIGIYNNKHGNVLNKTISLKELLPYLKSYNRNLTSKISGDDFMTPIMADYAGDLLKTIQLLYRELKIRKSDLSILNSNRDTIVFKFDRSLDIPTIKRVIHKMWTLYGNVFTMTSNYENKTVTVDKRDDNVADGEVKKLIKYNLK